VEKLYLEEGEKDRKRESESGFSMAGDVWVRPHLIKDFSKRLHCFFSFFVCMGG